MFERLLVAFRFYELSLSANNPDREESLKNQERQIIARIATTQEKLNETQVQLQSLE
jgi:hypothetical protein